MGTKNELPNIFDRNRGLKLRKESKLLKNNDEDKLGLMKIARSLFLLFLLVFPFGAIVFGQAEIETPTGWETVGEGIEYQKFRLTNPAPVDVFVARMARDNPNVTIESSIAQGRLSGGIETVSNMALRYDGALNFWGPPTIPVSSTWGSTNDVVVAINGFYYGAGIEPDGVPWSGQIHSGWYAKRYTDNESSSGFVWKMDRSAFIGGCVSHPIDKQYFYTNSGEQIPIDGVNESRGDDELILYTPQYDRDTNTDSSNSTEVLIEMRKPTYTSVFGNMPYGIVRKIRTNQGSTPIPYDHVVLSGQGNKVQELAKLSVGEEVGIAQRVKDCLYEPINEWDLAYAGVGGHWRFLRNGVIYPYDDDGQALVRDPRTAIVYNNDYIFFIVADGRNPSISDGMTVEEMANFAKYILGATDGIMQDGGGSSTMVINGQVVNNTYCNNGFCTEITVSPISGNTTEGGGTATFTIVLNTEPTDDVTIGLSSSDTGEGTVSPGSVTFGPGNWDTAQTVTVTGVDDDLVDGDQDYTIVTAAATSPDDNYDGEDAADVLVKNIDDEVTWIPDFFTYLPLVLNSTDTSAFDASANPAEPTVEWDAEMQVLQRLVANGMLMVVVQPMEKSTFYNSGNRVSTAGEINIRLGPGTNYAILNAANGDGTIVASLNNLNGVYAKGLYWWKVDFDGDSGNVVDGWVQESEIAPQLKLRRTNDFKAR